MKKNPQVLAILINDIQRTDAAACLIRDFALVNRKEMELYLSNVNDPNAAVVTLRNRRGPLTEATVENFIEGDARVVWKQNGVYHVGEANLVPLRIRPWVLETALDCIFASGEYVDSRD